MLGQAASSAPSCGPAAAAELKRSAAAETFPCRAGLTFVVRIHKIIPFTLGSSQWVYLSAVVLVVLPIVLGFSFLNQIYGAYLREFVAPGLQNEFGFQAGLQTLSLGEERAEEFIIYSVTPGGLLSRAGFQSGDIPVLYHHNFESTFYQDLLLVRKGRAVTIHVINVRDIKLENPSPRNLTLRLMELQK